MRNSILLSSFLLLATFPLAITALPSHPADPIPTQTQTPGPTSPPNKSPTDTNRYVPGDLTTIIQTITKDSHGALSVGKDGVLRSFAADGTVLDYHQLDPDQVRSFAASQLAAWEATGMDVPESVTALAAQAGSVDGRLVTEKAALFEPPERRDIARANGWGGDDADGYGDGDGDDDTISAARESKREVLEVLSNHHAKRSCVGRPCQSLSECLPNCWACFYPGGPPLGVCFLGQPA